MQLQQYLPIAGRPAASQPPFWPSHSPVDPLLSDPTLNNSQGELLHSKEFLSVRKVSLPIRNATHLSRWVSRSCDLTNKLLMPLLHRIPYSVFQEKQEIQVLHPTGQNTQNVNSKNVILFLAIIRKSEYHSWASVVLDQEKPTRVS